MPTRNVDKHRNPKHGEVLHGSERREDRDTARLVELKNAAAIGFSALDAGQCSEVPSEDLGNFIEWLGRESARLARDSN